jgi:putative intracellular protease/amidase
MATKRVLCLISEYGYWGEELIGPVHMLDGAGYAVDFITPTGKRPVPLPPSIDPAYVDPPLGRAVTDELTAARTRDIDSSTRLDHPISLKAWFPERPYRSEADFLRQQEAYYVGLDELSAEVDGKYDALLMVGGSGPTIDMVNNQRVHDLVLTFYKLEKPIAAECYAVTCLAFARDPGGNRTSIISGKRITGHCIEYDYKDGHGVIGIDFNFGPPPYPLEYILRDATLPDGEYIGNFGKRISCIVDYPFVTGRSTSDSYKTGEKLVEVLDQGLRRWGW